MARTFGMLVMDTIRECRGQADSLEAQQSLKDALNFIDSKANWEFLLNRALINTEAAYSTGTISVPAAGVTVTGVGTTWSAGWSYKTIKLASHTIPYDIVFGGATSGTLTSALSGTTAISGETYKVYQERYALPSDCEPGRELAISGPSGWGFSGNGKLRKIPATQWERYWSSQYSNTGRPQFWTDGPFDEVNNVPTIRFWPYPSTSQELQVLYYKKLTVPAAASTLVTIPEAFERLPIMLAAWPIMKRKAMPGWLETKGMAEVMLSDLYGRHAASPAYEHELEVNYPGAGGEGIFASDSLMFTTGGW